MNNRTLLRNHTKLEIIGNIVENVIKKLGNAVIGGYTAGSTNIKDDCRPLSPIDIDLHFVIDPKLLNKDYTVNTNRYGISIKIEDIPKIVPYDKTFAEILFLPKNSFSNIENILNSHAAYAAASNLYHSKIIYDPYSYIFKLKSVIVRKFPRKFYIRQRMDYVLSLAYQKLEEFKTDIYQDRLNLKVIWDGPLWALMSIGNLALTYNCITPTFRKHLVFVKKTLINLGFENKYEKLLNIWGFNYFKKEDIIFLLNYMDILYKTSAKSVEDDQMIHPLKYEYLSKGIKNMVHHGMLQESCFPLLYTLIHIGGSIEKHSTNEYSYLLFPIYEILNKMGYCGYKQNIEYSYKLKQINDSLLDYYETLDGLLL